MKAVKKRVEESVTPVAFVDKVVITLSVDEAKEILRLVGDTSFYDRSKVFPGAKSYQSRTIGADDVFGIMWEQIEHALQ